MKFNIIPSPKNYDALPDVLKKEAENQYARLKDKMYSAKMEKDQNGLISVITIEEK